VGSERFDFPDYENSNLLTLLALLVGVPESRYVGTLLGGGLLQGFWWRVVGSEGSGFLSYRNSNLLIACCSPCVCRYVGREGFG